MVRIIAGGALLALSFTMLLVFVKATPDIGAGALIMSFVIAVVLPAVGGTTLLYNHFSPSDSWLEESHEEDLERDVDPGEETEDDEADDARAGQAHGGTCGPKEHLGS